MRDQDNNNNQSCLNQVNSRQNYNNQLTSRSQNVTIPEVIIPNII